jgi:hypothetical protein
VILRAIRPILVGGIAFGALVALLGRVPAMPGPDAATAPAPAQDARARALVHAAASVDTPLGDAGFRIWCTWALRERLADRPEWTLPRVATLCLCLADLARARQAQALPDVRRAEFVTAVATVEERLCRPR